MIKSNTLIASIGHQKLKIQNPNEMQGDQFTFRKCYVNYLHWRNQRETQTTETEMDQREDNIRPSPINELIEVKIDVGGTLSKEQNLALIGILIEYKELFTWNPSAMRWINRDIISYAKIDCTINRAQRKGDHLVNKKGR